MTKKTRMAILSNRMPTGCRMPPRFGGQIGNVGVPGNIFIYAPRQRTLMVVDVISRDGCGGAGSRSRKTFKATSLK